MHRLILGSCVAMALCGSAVAADMPVKAKPQVPPAPYVSWTGCYVGGNGGGAWSQTHHTFDDGRILSENFDFDASTWIGGGQVGCQYQFDRSWVIGVEGTWDALGFNQTDNSAITPGDTRRFKNDQIATVVGRLGYTWDRVMLYGLGGYAAARIDTAAFEPIPGAAMDNSQWQSGVTAGGGLEYMVWQNVVLGVQANWYHFDFNHSGLDSTGVMNTWSNSHDDVLAVTGRVSFLFNFAGMR
jgi:outer membrane immunogenic protein